MYFSVSPKRGEKKQILDLLYYEAWECKVYTSRSFCDRFEGTNGLGSSRNIRYLIKELTQEKKIKFFQDYKTYALPPYQGTHGYLWVSDMRIPSADSAELQKIFPTHERVPYKDELNPL